MKIAYVILVAVALGFVVWDIIAQTIDFYTFLVAGVVVALSIAIIVIENREQKS
jgi:hypothetical protein